MRNRAYRKKQDARHKKQLRDISTYSSFPGVSKKNGYYVVNGRGRASKYLKKQSNRKLRRNCVVYKGNQYRKVFDYWWTLY